MERMIAQALGGKADSLRTGRRRLALGLPGASRPGKPSESGLVMR